MYPFSFGDISHNITLSLRKNEKSGYELKDERRGTREAVDHCRIVLFDMLSSSIEVVCVR